MDKKETLKRAKDMREMSYMLFIDALKGLKSATRLIDERVQKEGPAVNYSANSDLLEWAQSVWKHSNALYTIDQVIKNLSQDEIVNQEVQDDVAATSVDSSGG